MKLKRNLSLLIIAFFISTVTYGQSKEDAKTLTDQSSTLNKQGKYAEAVQKGQEAIKVDPDNIEGLYQLSLGLINLEKGKEAIPYLERIIKLNPNLPAAYDALGNTYYQNNQKEKALEYFLKGVKVDPNFQRFHYSLAIIYYNQNKYAEAEASAIQALKLNHKHANSQMVYALAAGRQNKLGNSLLGWCSFLFVEAQTTRSLGAMGYVKSIIASVITGKTDKNITATAKENNLNGASLMMSRLVIGATTGKKKLSPVDSLTLQLTAIFQAAQTIIDDKDQPFASQYLAGYFGTLGKTTNMPAFVRYISMSMYPEENKKWFAEHGKEFAALDIWERFTHRDF
ncbi:tetratricopeptide repeat protein [Mucilaginibacter sp. 14171R-50]|uniref:tetratricopeptide repeat protein n=1 Tax=Mucilaginibacter sp. 14171R-50 TaxID=2703789 RepID=UPI00138B69E9|nr:tetratricopeptide repeat protein [Mucilaginibacter sp. 14171R-50]QHS55151.1 tetratricopeptide repeat protein [Mucilaginibacter sp. 14171R-50]